jgi:hypothetical protein
MISRMFDQASSARVLVTDKPPASVHSPTASQSVVRSVQGSKPIVPNVARCLRLRALHGGCPCAALAPDDPSLSASTRGE